MAVTYDMVYVESGRKFAPRKRMLGCVVLDSDALARRAVAALDEQTVSRLRELFREPMQKALAANDSDEHVATIMTETDDGITGRAWCSRCGGSVHRSSRYCRHCGARFKMTQDDKTCRVRRSDEDA